MEEFDLMITIEGRSGSGKGEVARQIVSMYHGRADVEHIHQSNHLTKNEIFIGINWKRPMIEEMK